MKLLEVDEFVRNILPSAIKGKTALRGVFSSYNSVGHYPTGPVSTNKHGLEISVVNGNRDKDWSLMGVEMGALISRDVAVMQRYNSIEKQRAQSAQRQVEERVGQVSGSVFAVVYVGLNAPGTALGFAEKIRKSAPNSFIVIVTCSCELNEKQELFERHSSVIDALVVTTMCGGQGAMGAILEGLITQWPER